MGTSYELTATVREKVGKGAARAVRREGQIPAVIYGGKEPPVAIHLSDRDVFFKIHAGGFLTTVAEIKVNGETIRTLPRDFQLDPVSDRPLHVDFLRILPGSTIKVEVPVQFVNEVDAPGIKRGGVLNVVRHRVELLCPADGIPDRIVADLAGLEINDSLHISAIALPEGVRPTITRDFTIATIAAPAGVKEELRAAAAAASAPAAAEGAVDAKAEGGDAKKPEGGKAEGKK
jgi:large subunit ribosomal protein L25